MVVLAIVCVGFGAYELVKSEITNGLLSFILAVATVNLAVKWIETFGG